MWKEREIDLELKGLMVNGLVPTQMVALSLLNASMWFCVEPYPEDQYLVLVRKAEWYRLLGYCRNLFEDQPQELPDE